MATKRSTPANKSKLLQQLLQSALDSGDEELIKLAQTSIAKQTASTKKVVKKGQKDPKKRSGTAEFTGNTFNPDDYANEFKSDTEWTKRVEEKRPYTVSQRRPPAEEVEVKCTRCNKTEYIPESLAALKGETKSYYICNKCGGTR